MLEDIPLGTIIGGYIGRERSRGDREREERDVLETLRIYERLNLPIPDDLKYQASLLQYGPGEEAFLQDQTSLERIQLNPALREAQMKALASLEAQSRGEFGAEDRARLEAIQRDIASQERAQRAAIQQGMQRRGMSGSGLELAAQLSNQQAAAERASQESLGLEALAQRRALEALSQYGQQAGQIEQKDYARAAEAAQARDAINRFNVAQRTTAQQRNVDAQREQALLNQRAINRQREFNAQAPRDLYEMEMGKARGMAGGRQNMAELYGGRAKDIERMYTGIGASIDQNKQNTKKSVFDLAGNILGGGR